jgi:hypothetical protein
MDINFTWEHGRKILLTSSMHSDIAAYPNNAVYEHRHSGEAAESGLILRDPGTTLVKLSKVGANSPIK